MGLQQAQGFVIAPNPADLRAPSRQATMSVAADLKSTSGRISPGRLACSVIACNRLNQNRSALAILIALNQNGVPINSNLQNMLYANAQSRPGSV
jgi:hypothetical protein